MTPRDGPAAGDRTTRRPDGSVHLVEVGQYASGEFAADAAEILAHDPETDYLFVVNAEAGGVDVLAIDDPGAPAKVETLSLSEAWDGAGEVNNVAHDDGLLAVATNAADPQDPGRVVFFDARDLTARGSAEVGAMPDMVTFHPDGERVLVACAAEPDEDWERDPPAAVAVVDASDPDDPTAEVVDFTALDGRENELRERGVRLFGPGDHNEIRASRNLQPEYLALSGDGTTAYVVLQPNNAIAVLDVEAGEWTDVHPLGAKDHRRPGNELDASDADGGVCVRNWPVYGMYQPDAAALYEADGEEYLVTANEGTRRDDPGYSEVARVGDLDLDPDAFDLSTVAGVDSVADLARPENLGNLTVTTERGDVDGDGRFEDLYSFGGRSFAIWTTDGDLVYDSGAAFELLVAMHHPGYFNADGLDNEPLARSTDMGPEPEGIALGEVDGRTYAFVGLERIASLVVYDVTDPRRPRFAQYLNARDFDVDPEDDIGSGPREASAAGDLGPEGVTFVDGEASPIDDPLVAVGNELSGTTTLYRVRSTGGE